MKPFDLEEALNGKLVKLRSGKLARILIDLSTVKDIKCYEPRIVGIAITDDGYAGSSLLWEKDGSYGPSDYLDIVGMHEEPAKSQDEILEEAWQNKGKIVKTDACMTTIVEVIGKTADGEYIVHNPVDGLLAHIDAYGKLNWQPYEEPKGPVLNHNLVILHLPKPVGPREGENYWYISKKPTGELYVEHGRYSHSLAADRTRREQSNYFSSELDAQAWIDALNYARTGKVKIE